MLTVELLYERLPDEVMPTRGLEEQTSSTIKAELRKLVSRLLSIIYAQAQYKGTVEQSRILIRGNTTDDYYITLPRHLSACIVGGRAGHLPSQIQSQYYQYMSGGILTSTERHWGPLQDLGDGYATLRNITTASQITVASDQTEASGTTIRIRGEDSNGDKIASASGEGESVDLSTGGTTTASFAKITSITKDVTVGFVTITDDEGTLIVMEPGERTADYRRYLSGGYEETAFTHVEGIFKRKAVWLDSNHDPIRPDNIEAIVCGLQALSYRDSGDMANYSEYLGECVRILNADLKNHNLGIQNNLHFESATSGASFDNVH